jgi:hypothetical protein
MDSPSFRPLIVSIWSQCVVGLHVYIYGNKNSFCFKSYKRMDKKLIHAPQVEIQMLQVNLAHAMNQMESGMVSATLLEEEGHIQNKLQLAMRKEEESWRLTSISLWLSSGIRTRPTSINNAGCVKELTMWNKSS